LQRGIGVKDTKVAQKTNQPKSKTIKKVGRSGYRHHQKRKKTEPTGEERALEGVPINVKRKKSEST